MLTKIKTKIKTIFLAGLLFIVPIGFTVFILSFLFTKLDSLFTPLLSRILIYFGYAGYVNYHLPGLGFVLALTIIFLVGLLTKNFIGKRLVLLGEKIVEKIPFVSSLYTGAKQVIEAVATSRKGAFRQVVLVEYPRKGIYCIGLITCEARGEIQDKTERDIVNVFLPTTPNPTSGYLLFFPREDIMYLNMTVDDALKLVVSGGIVAPNNYSKTAALPPNPSS